MPSESSSPLDSIILGGGAAGLLCAATAGARGKSVLVLERAERLGKKILISGGGRCNFTNLHAGPDNYLCTQRDFPRSALAGYTPDDFIELVERHGIAYHEKKLGQLFCDGSSRQIVEMLSAECRAAGVSIRTNCNITGVTRNVDGLFSLHDTGGELARSRALVIATGGLSFPKLGSTDFGYRLARQFGLRIVPARPGLVPLTFAGEAREICEELSGVALPCIASPEKGGTAFHENMLFTHRGLSGPAVLQVSSYLDFPSGRVVLDLLPGEPDAVGWLLGEQASDRGREVHLRTVLSERLPARVADRFARSLGPARPLRQYSPKAIGAFAGMLRRWTLQPSGTEGYAKAEVTLGGVDTRDLSSKTMEARAAPGLFFVGEAVDVTGQLGGFNFQWAWASGFAAGRAL